MRAVTIRSFGGPEVLQVEDLPMPVAAAGEVVVKVAAATINPTDLNLRKGTQAAQLKTPPPYIAGMEFSGHVHALGAGTSGLAIGQPVMGIVNSRRPRGGGQVEYIALPAASVVAVPNGFDLALAATIPMNGLTAKLSVDFLALSKGAPILVTGGAGALGGYVIQLARHAGLRVIADAKDSDRALFGQLGVSDIVPRGDGMNAAVRALCPDGVAGAIDCACLNDTAAALVRDGGPFVSVRKSLVLGATHAARLRHTYVSVTEHTDDHAELQWLAARWAEGTLTPRVEVRLPCTAAIEANRRVEAGGLRGRVVLTF